MGNLMNERSQMDSLYSRYQGFLVPAARIRTGESGRDVTAGGAGIGSLTVSLSLDTPASAVFSLVNIYDAERRSFAGSVMDQLYLGNTVRIELGYGSSLERVFSGFIYSVKTEFSEMASVTVTALDVRRVMDAAVRKGVVWRYTTYSDIFKQVMEPYRKLYSRIVADSTPAKAVELMMQNESDLAFARRLAVEGNREFFVYDDVVYFRRKARRSPAVTLTWGKDLLYFSRESIYADETLTVLGLQKDSREAVTAQASVKTESSIRQVAVGGLNRIVASPTSDTREKAGEKAARLAEELRQKKQSGQGACAGLPQLVPGRPVAVAGLPGQINGTYQIKSVTHQFDGTGYETRFEIGGFG